MQIQRATKVRAKRIKTSLNQVAATAAQEAGSN
jgi:hypothetical protein